VSDCKTVNQALRAHLLADAEIVALVADRVCRKIAPSSWFENAPETPKAYIVFTRTGTDHDAHCGGPDGLAHSTYELVCWSRDADTTDDLADAVRRSLQEKYPMLGNGQHVVTLQGLTMQPDGELLAERGEGTQDYYHGVRMPFLIHYAETIGV